MITKTGWELEVCASQYYDALAAEEGGAQRIELCSALSLGGLTPSLGLLRQLRAKLSIAIFPLIRLRAGDFCYTPEEVAVMEEDIRLMRLEGADGFVFGCLTSGGDYDTEANAKLLEAAGGLPCTFHRAFDIAPRRAALLSSIIEDGFVRLLTSGGAATALEGVEELHELVLLAKDRIKIQCGSGVMADNILSLAQKTGARCFHGSFHRPLADASLATSAEEVARAREQLLLL